MRGSSDSVSKERTRKRKAVEKRLREIESQKVIKDGSGHREGHTYTSEELEFMLAMEQYERDNHRPFPTVPEVLAVVRALGYRKVNSQ